MQETGIIGIIIIIANAFVSYKGLQDHGYFEKYLFQVDEILINKDYKRLVTSGFLHVSWTHFLFNMLTLYCFSYEIEARLGPTQFLLIYFGSLIGGNFFSLFIHRNHGDYSAVGASGAVSGIVFASIALFPGMEMSFFQIPFYIPAWAYGLFYVLISIYGIKSQRDNIGHEAHLGGGLIGLLLAVAMVPVMLVDNYLPIVLIVFPSSIFIYFIITRPEFLLVDNFFQKKKKIYHPEERYNTEKRDREKELDRLLDKISKNGIDALTKKEKEKLKQYSE